MHHKSHDPLRKALIIGGTSGIGRAVAEELVIHGYTVVIVGRHITRLQAVAAHLRVVAAVAEEECTDAEPGGCAWMATDFSDLSAIPDVVEKLWSHHQGFDFVLITHGNLPDQAAIESDVEATLASLHVNLCSPLSWIIPLAWKMADQGTGHLVVIGSVAGDRGRRSNFIYGAAKSGLATYVQGLRHRLAGSGVQITLIKPGFIATPMTAHLPQGALFTDSQTAARLILKAAERGQAVAYVPGYWRWIMSVIRLIPTFIMERTRL